VLIAAGLQVPVTALFEVFGRDGAAEFRHSGPICVNAGVIRGSITIVIEAVAAH
jgi:hypothetical protein